VPTGHVEDGYRLGQWTADQRNFYRVGRLSEERGARLEALPGWAWNTRDAAWEEGYSALTRFAARTGHSRAPKIHREDGYRLGQWVEVQRRSFAEGRLSSERVERLSALPGWVWNTYEADWEQGFNLLSDFVAREGHARVPHQQVEGSYPLGQWAARLRAAYGAGRLLDERAAVLAALPGWEWNRQDAAWENGYSALQHFASREGHTRVPISHVEDGFQLGKWVSTQRTAHRVGRLSEERTQRLAAMPGWAWRPLDALWADGFSVLERFVAREGHARVTRNHVEKGFPLGPWVKEQRSMYREGRLPDDRATRLVALPGWVWNARK
jgi:Helicase associated domain